MWGRHGDESRNVCGGEKSSAYNTAHGMTHDNDLGAGRVTRENILHRRRCIGNLRIECRAMKCGEIFIELHWNVNVLNVTRN